MAKNIAAAGGTAASVARSSKHLYCELCDVVCTCNDTFAAHLRGTKHNKVLMIACDLLLAAAMHDISVFASSVLLCTSVTDKQLRLCIDTVTSIIVLTAVFMH